MIADLRRLLSTLNRYGADVDPEVDGYVCAACNADFSHLKEGCEWTNGNDICDACQTSAFDQLRAALPTLMDRIEQAEMKLAAANDFIRVIEQERDHAQRVEVVDAVEKRDRMRDALTLARKALADGGITPSERHGDCCFYCDWPINSPWPDNSPTDLAPPFHRPTCPLLAIDAALSEKP